MSNSRGIIFIFLNFTPWGSILNQLLETFTREQLTLILYLIVVIFLYDFALFRLTP